MPALHMSDLAYVRSSKALLAFHDVAWDPEMKGALCLCRMLLLLFITGIHV